MEGWETRGLYRARATRPAPARPTGACWDPEPPPARTPRVSRIRPGLRLRPRSRLSRLGSRAFKEPSARPRPSRLRALLHVTSPAPAPTRVRPRGPRRLRGCPGNCSPAGVRGSAPRRWLQCGHPAPPPSPPGCPSASRLRPSRGLSRVRLCLSLLSLVPTPLPPALRQKLRGVVGRERDNSGVQSSRALPPLRQWLGDSDWEPGSHRLGSLSNQKQQT